MSIKKAAAIVESPFQMLCAYEAFKEEKGAFDVYVRLNGKSRNDWQLRVLAEDLFGQVDYLTVPLKNNLFSLFSVISLVWKLNIKNYSKLYLGSFHSRFIKKVCCIGRIKRAKFIFLDDGMATLLVNQNLIDSFSCSDMELLTVFRCLDSKIFVRNHSFENLRALTNKNFSRGGAYFIGQPLIQRSFVTKIDYFNCVATSVSRSPDNKIFYIAHRDEDSLILSEINEIPGCEVVELDVCIEWYMIKKKIAPLMVFGSSSTALLTLGLIFPEANICIFNINYKNYPNIRHYEKIIDYLVSDVGANKIEAGVLF